MASASGTASSAPPALPAWLSPVWLRAGGLGALATVLLLLKWTLLVPAVYESQAVVAINRPVDEKEPATLRKLLALGGGSGGGGPSASRAHDSNAVQVEALPLDGQHVAFVCRAAKAHTAHSRCGELVTRALGAKLARSVPRPATLPAKSLPFEHGWGIWLLSCIVGVVAALCWVAGHKLLHMRLHLPARALEGTRAGRASHLPASSAHSEVRSDRPSAIALGEGGFPEHLRTLRDHLFLLAADSCFVVGVTGTRDQADGKAIVAGQLALALAESEQVEVLLLEADFDQPAVHLVMDISMPPLAGFSQQIHQGLQQPGAARPWTVVRRAPSLSVLAEGMLRTPGMMYSAQFSAAVSELRNAYDIIVVSGPAAGASADVQAFADVVDGVVFVPLAKEDPASVNRTANQIFRNKRFVSVVAPPQLDEV